MTPAARQIVFINTAHTITHYSLLILPTAVLAMAVPGGPFGQAYGPILALATGMFVLYGLLSLPQGWLAQRFGRKALMTAFFLGTGGSLIASGLATFAGDAGGRPGLRRRVRRDLPPDRHDDAGRGRRRQTWPLDRGERRVRQPRRGPGACRDRLPRQRDRLARRLCRARAALRRRRSALDAHAPRACQRPRQRPAVPADPAPPRPACGAGADADRDLLGPGVQRLHHAAAQADAGAAGRKRDACCRWSALPRSWSRCAAR